MKRLFELFFKIHPGELKKALLFFFLCMGLVSVAFTIGRTMASSLFLHRVDTAFLPYTYVAVAVAVSLASAVYSRLSGKLRRDHTFMLTMLLFAIVLLGLRGVLALAPDSLAVVGSIYVFVEILAILSMIQYWTLANDVFTSREGKRLFAFISAGSALAQVVFGGLVKSTVSYIGAENLLIVMAVELIVCMALIRVIGKMFAEELDRLQRKKPPGKREPAKAGLLPDLGRIARSGHLKTLAGILLVMSVTVTIIDYQWKVSAKEAYIGDENGLAGYFGMFYLITGVGACVFQFFLTSRILERYGILFSLILLPGAFFAASAGILAASARKVVLWAATGASGANTLLRYTVNSSAIQLLFLPTSPDFRPRAKAIIEGIMQPVTSGLTGLLIAAIVAAVGERDLSYVVLGLVLVWLVLTVKVRGQYVRALADRIRKRKLDLNASMLPVDEATVSILEKALAGDDKVGAASALELIGAVPEKDWGPAVLRLLDSPGTELKIRALAHLERNARPEYQEAVGRLLEDDDGLVRVAAVMCICAVKKERCMEAAGRFLRDDHLGVRGAAAAGMIRYGGPEAASMALGKLEEMLADNDARVRYAALKSAGAAGDTGLTRSLARNLANGFTARVAADALVDLGEGAFGELSKTLADTGVDIEARERVPRILQRIGSPRCMEILLENIEAPQARIRSAASAAAGRLAQSDVEVETDTNRIWKICLAEVKEYFQLARMELDLAGFLEAHLLGDAIEHLRRKSAKRILDLLSIMHSGEGINVIAEGFESARAASREDALELLDNILTGHDRLAILTVFEDSPLEKQAAVGEKYFPYLERKSAPAWLSYLLEDKAGWLAACALYQVGASRLTDLADKVKARLDSKDPVVVQAALGALRELVSAEEFVQTASSFKGDQRPIVAGFAEDVTQTERP